MSAETISGNRTVADGENLIDAAAPLVVTPTGVLNFDGSSVANSNNEVVNGGRIALRGGVGTTVNLGDDATVTNQASGEIDVQDGATLSSVAAFTNSGEINVGDGSALRSSEMLITSLGTLRSDGTLSAQGGGDSDITNRGILIAAGIIRGDVTTTNGGEARFDEDLTLFGDMITEDGGISRVTVGTTELNGGDADNSGELIISDGATLDGDVDNTATGELTIRGTVDGEVTSQGTVVLEGEITSDVVVDSGSFTTQTDAAAIGGTLEVNADATANLNATATTIAGDLDVNGTAIVNSLGDDTVTVSGDVTVGTNATVNLDGTVNAANVANSGAFNAEGSIFADMTNDGSAVLTTTETLVVHGDVSTADAADIDLGAGTTLSVRETFTHGSTAEITVDAGETLTADRIEVEGALTSAGTVSSDDDVIVLDGGTLTSSGDITAVDTVQVRTGGTLVTTGTLTTGDLINRGDIQAEGTISGAVFNRGTDANFEVTGFLTLDSSFQNGEGATLTVDGAVMNGITTLNANGTTVVQNAGTLTAEAISVGANGDLTVDETSALNGPLTITGTVANDGTVTGATTVNSTGSLTSTGTINGAVINAGTSSLEGTVSGNVTTEASGETTVGAAGLNVGGAFATTDNATATISGDMAITGALQVGEGTTVTNNATLTAASVDVDGTLVNNAGGSITSAGATSNTSSDTLRNAGTYETASLNNSGTVFNLETGTFTVTTTFANSGTFDNDGALIGPAGASVINTDGGVIRNSGAITGDVANQDGAVFSFDGADASVTGVFTNSGILGDLVDPLTGGPSGLTIFGGPLTNAEVGSIVLDAGGTITVDTLNNNGLIRFGGDGGVIAGDVNNRGGTIRVDTADAVIDGSVTQSDSATGVAVITMRDGEGLSATDDQLTITGDLVGGVLGFDVDLSSSNGAGDLLIVGGTVTGAVQLNFTSIADGAILGGDGLQVIDGDTSGGVFVTSGLLDTGPLTYDITSGEDGLYVVSVVDSSAASVSGNIGLVQSLIGTIVNRPSSPFVTGLAYEDENNCVSGAWTRATGGRASGTSDTDNGFSTTTSTVDASYAGLTFGYDYGCFEGAQGEFDIAGGVILGFNTGSTEQVISSSTTEGDFDQAFLGFYVTGATGPWNGDLQLRFEKTNFSFTNEDIGLYDESISSDGISLSGSVSYTYPLSDEFALVPTVGFGITKTQTETLTFRDGEDGDSIGELEFDDHTTKIGFAGVTLVRSVIGEAGDSLLNQFITATYYADFSDDSTSTFVLGEGGEQAITNGSLGGFGELSIGLGYTKILDGQVGNAKQFNATVRLDGRFSENVDSLGVTAQLRLLF